MTERSGSILQVENLGKTYAGAGSPVVVLEDVSFRLEAGETCAVLGPSGCGKTTLIGLCAGLDRPTHGGVELCGRRLNDLSEDQLAELRRDHVGFVFQTFELIPTLTARENVMVTLELRGERGAGKEADELLGRVGLAERLHHFPSQLSGGEQQRVALARAFVHRPTVLFADEPTGNLDEQTGHGVVELLFELNREAGTTLVLVTHDRELAARTGRTLRLRKGRLEDVS